MQKIQIESYILVGIQFLCAVSLIYLALPYPLTLISILMITIALAIGLWAMLAMRIGNFTVAPIPKNEAKLTMTGPYLFIRHPMYAAVLLAMLGLAAQINSSVGYVIYGILMIDLLIKLRFEEKLLLERFSEYKEYMKRTKKLLPFLW